MFERDRRRVGSAARRRLPKDVVTHTTSRRSLFLESLEQRLVLHTSAIISEVMYFPPDASDTELSSIPTASSHDFEYIELLNPSPTESLSLLDMRLEGDVEFVFPDEQLAPNAMVVVAANPAAFAARYGSLTHVLGPWQGALADQTPHLSLIDSDGHNVVDLELGGVSLWPFRANGLASSLELINPLTTLASQMSKPGRWQASFEYLGTPGQNRSTATGVVINEVLAGVDASSGLTDRVELRNTTSATIDMSGWYLGNRSGDPRQYQLPAGTVLSPGEFLVLDAHDFDPTPGAAGPQVIRLDAVHGDQLHLVRETASGQVIRFEDSVRFGPSGGNSWGRDPGQDDLFTVLRQPTLGGMNATGTLGSLLISEINFHPSAPTQEALQVDPTLTSDELEYVELYNPTAGAVDLSNWALGGVVDWTFAGTQVLQPEESLVVVAFDPQLPENAARVQAFRTQYGIDATVTLAGPYQGQQPDNYGQVTLLEPGVSPPTEPDYTPQYLRDEARYDDVPPWPIDADGKGLALDRLGVDASGLTADGWMASLPTPGQVRFAPPPSPLLPDLTIWDDPLLGLNYFSSLDVHPRTGHRIMRFSTAVQNAGQGPLTVQGGAVVGNQQQVVQVVQNEDGSTTEYAAGEYVFHPTHGHVHFADYAFYSLYQVAPDGGLGASGRAAKKSVFA